MKTTSIKEFQVELDEQKLQNILDHFNTIYECTQLSEHEIKIAYLAWLWKEGFVYGPPDDFPYITKEETGMDMEDFQITFEDEDGGCSLDFMHSFYDFYKLINLV